MFRLTDLSAIDFNQLFNLSPNPYVLIDRDWRLVGMNDAYLAVTARRREDILGKAMFEAFPSAPDSLPRRLLGQSMARVFAAGAVDHLPLIPYPIADQDGRLQERYWSATHTPVRNDAGEVVFILQHTVDVTELHLLRQSVPDGAFDLQTALLRRADAIQNQNVALGEERDYLSNLFEQAPGFMAVLQGPDHVFRFANHAYRALIARDDVTGKTVREALPDIAGQGFYELLDDVYRTGIAYSASAARILLRPSPDQPAEERFLDFVYQPTHDGEGRIDGIFVQGHDVTELKRVERAAAESEERFRTLAQALPNQVWTASPDGRVQWVNNEVHRYSGLDDVYFDQTVRSGMLHPEDRDRAAAEWVRAIETGTTYDGELRLRRFDGVYRWFLSRAVPVTNPRGEIVFWVATNTDIDEQKRTETNLENLATSLGHRIEERTVELEKTQEVLRQSQKMEAIGNLAGGIAHDFNNLLQVITGNLQLLSRDIAGNALAEKRLNSALAGAARGARLSSQLLSFGRRQPLAPRVLNLGRLVGEMDHLLRRSLGEAIEIETIVGSGLWNTLADMSNVENALLNLAINARDAMEVHGKLTIEISNAVLDEEYAQRAVDVRAGQYVMLAVTDTGSGIPADIIDRVFDPFFTTKPEGKGTGLGLSMVYGFVKQSGGHIRIHSQPGLGTTVRIYLPRSLEAEEVVDEPIDMPSLGGHETVLVVEDDDAVRETTIGLLSELGYRVLQARDAASGLAIVEGGAAIDLLFTDVVMPGRLQSHEMARRAQEILPGIAVLFTSGYTENSIVHGGRLDPGLHLLSKPYTRDALARKLRQLLDRPRSEAEPFADSGNPVAAEAGQAAREGAIRVLLIEDEALIRISTADFLLDSGFEVLEAGTAAEAIAVSAENSVDILVCDVNLPDMGGLQLVQRLRQERGDIPVIFATGDMKVEGAEDLPHSTLITKPYDYDRLAALIRSMA